jgi:acyl-CoA synthetase (AMP-forming)/AMP-acid ligase II
MAALVDLLDDAAAGGGEVEFRPSGRVVPVAELWRAAGRAAAGLDAVEPSGAAIAMVLEAGPDAVIALLAAVRAGRRVVSMPMPGRAASADAYLAMAARILERSRAQLLLMDAPRLAGLPPLGIGVSTFQAVAGWDATSPRRDDGGHDRTGFELVQFSSGTTSEPKGIVLDDVALAANIAALLERLAPMAGDGSCSWLPLSHDMGLIGMTLAPMVASGPGHAGHGRILLIRPEELVRDPGTWLRAVAERRSTVTAAPDFAYRLVTRRADPSVDLGSLRCAIVGGEPIDPVTLDRFADRYASSGFVVESFCPAYGLAEMGLAVTLAEPGGGLGVRRAPGRGHPGREHVSCGPPLAGYDVAAGTVEEPGTVFVRGPSAVKGYVGAAGVLPDDHGWLATGDVGFVDGGELYVQGRADDVVWLAGQNVHLIDVDRCLTGDDVPGVASAYACPHPDGGYAVVAELNDERRTADALAGLARVPTRHLGFAPTEVVAVAKGNLPRTSSGKPQRSAARDLIGAGRPESILGRRGRRRV